MVKMCIYKGKSPSLPWSQITSSDSNDFIIQALTPLDAIVYESGAFGGVCGAHWGAYIFHLSRYTSRGDLRSQDQNRSSQSYAFFDPGTRQNPILNYDKKRIFFAEW